MLGGGPSLFIAASALGLSLLNVDPTFDRSGYASRVLLVAAVALVVHLVSGIAAFVGHAVGRWLALASAAGRTVLLGSAIDVAKDWTLVPTILGLSIFLFCAYALAFRWDSLAPNRP